MIENSYDNFKGFVMDVNTLSSTSSTFSHNLIDKASEAIQKKGIEVIQKTVENSQIDDKEKAKLVDAQMSAFGVTQSMLDKASGKEGKQIEVTTPIQTSPNASLSQTQQSGLDIIQKTLEMKINDTTKNEIVQAQMKAFNVSQEMIESNDKPSTEDRSNTETDISIKQQNGLDTLFNDLNSNIDDSTKKELLKKDIKLYDLSQNMINQTIERFADGDQEKYVQAKTLLGSNMGFDFTA